MIVDVHMHVWRYPEHFHMDVYLQNEPPRRRTWSDEKWKAALDNPIENYFPEMGEGGVDKAIIMGSTEKSLGIEVPNDYTAELVRKYPDKFVGTAAICAIEEGAVEEVERCVKELGLIGLSEVSGSYEGYALDDERCFPVWEKAQELGIPIWFHAGFATPRIGRMKFMGAEHVDEVAINFPNLKIIICHMGYYRYEDYIMLMQKHENVFADISWLTNKAGLDRRAVSRYLPVVDYAYYYHWLHPLLYYFSQTWGATDKLLFGTDWPEVSPRRTIELLNNINETLRERHLPEIPAQSIHNILHENWKKVIQL